MFTRVSACLVARSPKVTRYTRVLQQICYLLYRPGCFRPSDRLAGRDSHPLEIADFHGIHVSSESNPTGRWPLNRLERQPANPTFFGSCRGSSWNATLAAILLIAEIKYCLFQVSM